MKLRRYLQPLRVVEIVEVTDFEPIHRRLGGFAPSFLDFSETLEWIGWKIAIKRDASP
jgi:hypothetical protein